MKGLVCLEPESPLATGVRVFCTTRIGGFSSAPYDSLNLGLHVNDDPDTVHANRRLVLNAQGAPGKPCWLKQVHGVSVFHEEGHERSEAPEADAAFTRREASVLAVLTADCLPVAVAAAEGHALALAHAGWRSLAGGVLENVLDCFDAAEPLRVWLGPAIGPDAFEVGPEVRAAFVDPDAAQATAFRPSERPGHYYADLHALARRVLMRSGRSLEIESVQACTYRSPDKFYSHRREGPATGRMAMFGWLENSAVSR